MTKDPQTSDAVADEPEETLAADVVTYAGAPDECTLSPRAASEERETTAWITARGDAFVAVAEMR